MITALFIFGIVLNFLIIMSVIGLIGLIRSKKIRGLTIYAIGLALVFVNPLVAIGYFAFVWAIKA